MSGDTGTRRLLAFCLRSLATEYGAGFLSKVALRHPWATLRGVWRYTLRPVSDEERDGKNLTLWSGGSRSLVGVGFCLKPLAPTCPSGRANHDCLFLERVTAPSGQPMSAPCPDCLIRTLAMGALAAGSAFYIMTSARDMLVDVLVPALVHRRFTDALLTLCRFSYEPMRLALAIAGLRACIVPFESGDCRDHAEWRRADLGDKPDQTRVATGELATLMALLANGAPPSRIARSGNVYETAPQVDGRERGRTAACRARASASQF